MPPRFFVLAACLLGTPALAQHADSTHTPAMPGHDDHAMEDPAEPTMAHDDHAMGSTTAPSAPMARNASGTGWLPDASPMEAVHGSAGPWSLMLHGAAFPRITAQDAFSSGDRSGRQVGAPNWVMGMAQRPLGDRAALSLRLMASAERATEGGAGYPLLFQTGETFEDERLVDSQHPHDVVSEFSATVATSLSSDVGAFAYAAYPGEPAIGPPAFMHRPSARFTADSPLSHHWQDATHIAWGVATGGIVAGPLKVDGSVFTGREPDEDRLTPDAPRFDSFSGRLTLNPTDRLSFQVSRASLREPEAAEPGVDQTRTTASALYAAPFGPDGDLTASLIWGLNEVGAEAEALKRDEGHAGAFHALLAEATLRRGATVAFGRAEWVEKSGEELALTGDLADETHRVGALSLGLGREIARPGGLALVLGGQAGVYRVPEALRPLYGDAPVSLQAFLRLSPPLR